MEEAYSIILNYSILVWWVNTVTAMSRQLVLRKPKLEKASLEEAQASASIYEFQAKLLRAYDYLFCNFWAIRKELSRIFVSRY